MSTVSPMQFSESETTFANEILPTEIDQRILIVDDDVVVCNLFAQYLSENYRCTTASSCNEALAHLSNDSFALVISDITMPGRNGIELLREIVMRYPDTLVIMVSAVDRPQRIRDALRLGAFDYLMKPCELDVLSISVERALQRRALLRTANQYKADLEKRNAELARQKAELQRLQAQLVQSAKMASLGQLAAGIAHELNNPAGFIYGNVDLLKDYAIGLAKLFSVYDEVEMPEDLHSQLTAIKAEIHFESFLPELNSIIADCREGAERIRDVVQNLRLFSRLDEAEVMKVDLHEALDSTIRLLSRYLSSGHVRLIRQYGDLPLVSCYAGQLNQVWMNLLVNAAQAVGDCGDVTITTTVERESVVVRISDTGCGIPVQELTRIFDPFFTTKAVGEGTGLGLSISYGIVERHGGTISVASVYGEGSTFTVKIPIAGKPREQA